MYEISYTKHFMKNDNIINGKQLAEDVLADLHQEVSNMENRPGLAAIMIGDDPASKLYVNNKKKACEKVGINFYDYYIGGEAHPNDTEKEVIAAIEHLNKDPQVDAIIVQLPAPDGFDSRKIISAIDPKKDVDGLHQENIEAFTDGTHTITPPLVNAVKEAMRSTEENFEGKKAVLVANTAVFAQPIAEELEREKLTVSTTTPDKLEAVGDADVLVTVVGKPSLITQNMVKDGVTIIDIGTTMNDQGKVVGDVQPDVAEVADHFTPVPGGIGPLTVAMLLRGTYELAKKNGK